MTAYATTMKKLEVAENSIAPVQGSLTYSFNVTLYEQFGRAWVGWNTNYPGYVRLAVAIFQGPVPTSPNPPWTNGVEVTGQASGAWDSGQIWGSGYSAALLGVTPDNAQWIDVGIVTPVTSG